MKIEISYPGQDVQIVNASPNHYQHYVKRGWELPFIKVIDEMKYDRDLMRYSHLSGFAARTDTEQAEAEVLHRRFAEETGWTLYPRDPRYAKDGEFHPDTPKVKK